jgi:alkaline phosphatase
VPSRNAFLRRILPLVCVCALAWPSSARAQIARNVILMVGDGMCYQHVDAGSYYLTGAEGNLCFEPFHRCGVTTYSANASITDSAAAASAMATGYKVNNNVISQAPNGTPYQTILEKAKAAGKRTGLVTTDIITGATPAGFGAHDASRSNYVAIGDDYLYGSRPDIIFGGADPARGATEFTATQVAYAQSTGYQVVYDYTQMAALNPATVQRALGLFAADRLTYEYDRLMDNTEPHLAQMATKALDFMAIDPDGFFLMIEGANIDPAAHANSIARTTREVVEFHNTVQIALNWIAGRNDTMLIVVADHETGGLTATKQGTGNYPTATWTTTGHTSKNVPVYTAGAGANLWSKYLSAGVIDNTDIYRIMDAALRPEGPLISTVKAQSNPSSAVLTNKIVTAGTNQFASTFYTEDQSRTSGIKVSATGLTVNAGDRVDVTGTIDYLNGERVVTNPTVSVYPGPHVMPDPYCMTAGWVGGSSLNSYTPGVTGGVGAHNTGLLVTVCGRVSRFGTDCFYVDDGSMGGDPRVKKEIMVYCGGLASGNSISMPTQNAFVVVTGISARRMSGSDVLPCVRPRKQSDIVPY